MPAEKPTNSLSSTSFFFLPIARRSRSALPRRVAGQLLRDRHDLLLVHDQPVGLAEDLASGSQLRVDRLDRLRPVLAQRVVGVGVRRPSGRAGRARGRPRCPRSCPASSSAAGPASGRRRAGTRRACRRARAARRSACRRAAGLRQHDQVQRPRLASMFSSASSMIVRLRRPRKSILTRPSASQVG